MADAPDSKSGEGNLVWVRLPPPAPDSQTPLDFPPKTRLPLSGNAEPRNSYGYPQRRLLDGPGGSAAKSRGCRFSAHPAKRSILMLVLLERDDR